MAVQEYNHTRKILINDITLPDVDIRACLLNNRYTFAPAQTSYTQTGGLVVADQSVEFYTEFTDKYKLQIETVLFPLVNGVITGVLFYLDGFYGGVDRPTMFYINLPEGEFINTEYRLFWDVPLFAW